MNFNKYICDDGIPAFSFNSQNNLKYKTFITQEMLKSNILASNVIYICVNMI